MLFNSIGFIVFFPIVVLVYYIIPRRYRYLWLLASSYFFYGCFDIRYLLILLGVTLVTYAGGIGINKLTSGRKILLAACLIVCLGLLGTFKFLNFRFSLILPVGISFYTFKSIGYVLDVYMGRTEPEKNFLKYSLFVSFFPQLVAGPIDRSNDLLPQINEPPSFDEEKFRKGALLILFGYFEKLLIADRLAVLVNTVYDNYTAYSGAAILFATVLYALQIYSDFAGYSHMAIGCAGMMGYRLMENFRRPYMAVDIRDFWRRWHISMSSWFRDYLYFPLGGNRKGKIRKHINNMITFLASGLWHGSSLNFIAWGGLHGVYNLLNDITYDFRNRVAERCGIKRQTFGYRLFCGLLTFAMADFAWLFFRADSLRTALAMVYRIFTDFRLYSLSGDFIYELGLSESAVRSLPLAIMVLFAVDLIHEKGGSILRWFDEQGTIFRWICYVSSVIIILLVAVQNLGQSTGAFIYFRF